LTGVELTWELIRTHYAALLTEARRAGVTQDAVARAGQLPGQNAISKLLANHNLGPSVETFIKAVRGLGKEVSEFFAELERPDGPGALAPPEQSFEDRIRQLEIAVEALAASITDHFLVAQPSPSSPASSSEHRVDSMPCAPQGRPHGAHSLSGSGVVNNISTVDLRQFEQMLAAHFDRLERRTQEMVDRRAADAVVHSPPSGVRQSHRRRAR
jgi:transcriptional regulator with XRE-family HTH domain